MANSVSQSIIVKGAREHNLKDVDVKIPKNKLVVITGLSGSGKSSLAFDTIYAEGQRKYVESLSAYARQFLGLMEKPDVDLIEGLSPAISIDQKTASHNPRSTVGTVTEIYDYLRLLFARVGTPHCPECGRKVEAQSVQQIVDRIVKVKSKSKKEGTQRGERIMVLAPVVKNRKGTYEELFENLLAKGFIRVRVDGEVRNLEEDIRLKKYQKHNIEVIVDRLVIPLREALGGSRKIPKPAYAKEVSARRLVRDDGSLRKRVTDSVETALNLGDGELIVAILPRDKKGKSEDKLFSEHFACPECGISFPEIEPHTFSFNSPFGACPTCTGLGSIKKVDPELVYNPNLTILEGALYPWQSVAVPGTWMNRLVQAMADGEGIDTRKPMGQLADRDLNKILFGTKPKKYNVVFNDPSNGRKGNVFMPFEGIVNNLERRYKETQSEYSRNEIEKYMRDLPCPECHGARLKKEALAVKIAQKNIKQVTELSVKDAENWIKQLQNPRRRHSRMSPAILTQQQRQIARQVLKELRTRLDFLLAVGLEYLTLNRTARTLSGGESQRIRLASQIGTGLTGVLYVLDEPSIGLHQRDNQRLLDTLKWLRDLGNTVIVVEHDEATIRQADHIIDIGPGAGEHGGKIVAQGKVKDICKVKRSWTGKYLSGELKVAENLLSEGLEGKIPKPAYTKEISARGQVRDDALVIKGAQEHNLKSIDVNFPLGKLICITGVSGSGKSTLVNEILYKALAKEFYSAKDFPGQHDVIEGIDNIDKVINIDQSPIGRTPRSNPATYTGVFTPIRELFAKTKEARARGYKPGRFSFNVKGGRCENCQGGGLIKIEMQFLPDVYVECEVCKGKRYNREALQIDYKGKNIADVLQMTVEEANEFFKNIPAVKKKLDTLKQVGLGYIRLGQAATTLSGGEAQRVKLSTELSKRSTGQTLYILDEPTTGLHFYDVDRLLSVLHKLVDKGNTVIVIEHNLDVIKTADWIIDLGPEGGEKGGEVVVAGTVEEVVKCKGSYTGKWLRNVS